MAVVDVVVVSFESAGRLRGCVQPLTGLAEASVIVVDNASTDGSLETIADLPVQRVARSTNGGFACGVNDGWRVGSAPYVLLLNPDARIDRVSLLCLVGVLEAEPAVGAAGPLIRRSTGELDFSQRRFPRVRSTFSRALLLHRAFPEASWSDEIVRDPRAYARPGSPEWVSGACLLVRRSALVQLGGLDEEFFLYSEDTDLCRRLRDSGWEVRFQPDALCLHEGGASAPRAGLLPLLAASRIRYARKHLSRSASSLERAGVGLESLVRLLSCRGTALRQGHARSLRVALSGHRQPSRGSM